MRRLLLAAVLVAGFLTCTCCRGADESGLADNQVLIVLVFDQSCKVWCQQVRPMVRDLEQKYGGRVKYVELDASPGVLKESEKTAKSLSIHSFFTDAADWVPLVGIFDTKRRLVKELVGPKKREVYIAVIERALSGK